MYNEDTEFMKPIVLDEMQQRVLSAELRNIKKELADAESLCLVLFSALCRAPQHRGDECDRYARKAIREAISKARASRVMKSAMESVAGKNV